MIQLDLETKYLKTKNMIAVIVATVATHVSDLSKHLLH